jgi:diguanylate cyclase (GGDEF)-like protein
MVTALVAAAAALLGIGLTLLVTRLSRARADRQLEPVRERIRDHVQAISQSLERMAELAAEATAKRRDELELNLDLGALLEQLVAEASRVTGAQAVAVRVEGPGGTPVVASSGTSDGAALLETALGPPDARPFRALTINWTYGPAVEDQEDAYRSALVVPVIEDGAATGALVAYAGQSGAFQPEHLHALRALADEAAPGLANARRFAELGKRSLTDVLTGILNRSGYELELEREVARAHRTGRPLSLLLVELREDESADPSSAPAEPDAAVQEFAALLTRTVRATDIPCRRRARGFAVVLPETKDDGARRFYSRLREETGATFGRSDQTTFSVGLVEWRPNETSDSLDARAAAAVDRGDIRAIESSEGAVATAIELGRGRRRAPAGSPGGPPARAEPRSRLLEHLTREVVEARRLAHPLAVAAIEVDDLRSVEDRLGRQAADALRTHVAARIDDSVDHGGVTSRLGTDRFAVVLPQATAADAQSVLAVLQASLEVRPPDDGARATVSAGIGELAAGDDAASLLERAERALRQARRAGGGTVVVAGDDARP